MGRVPGRRQVAQPEQPPVRRRQPEATPKRGWLLLLAPPPILPSCRLPAETVGSAVQKILEKVREKLLVTRGSVAHTCEGRRRQGAGPTQGGASFRALARTHWGAGGTPGLRQEGPQPGPRQRAAGVRGGGTGGQSAWQVTRRRARPADWEEATRLTVRIVVRVWCPRGAPAGTAGGHTGAGTKGWEPSSRPSRAMGPVGHRSRGAGRGARVRQGTGHGARHETGRGGTRRGACGRVVSSGGRRR
jgi:hypothetical protein